MFPVPTSLSPSRVESFLSCPLQFRFASIEKLYEPPAVHTTRGSLVHRALELLFTRPAEHRTGGGASECLDAAIGEYLVDPEFVDLSLDDAATEQFFADARRLVDTYLTMEDPRTVREIGLELRLEAEVEGLLMRGVIDRLDLDDDGELVVVDYKTGRVPNERYQQSKMTGIHFYSYLCEQLFGKRPAKIRLMYLSSGVTIDFTPSAQSVRFVNTRTTAVLRAVEKACVTGTFLPRPGALCNSCGFQKWCPSFGGNPDLAAVEAPRAVTPVAA
jgi:putative RecB family exonuclease